MKQTTVLKTMLLLAPVWWSCMAIAQVEPAAADLLAKARQAHGGDALEAMATYREAGSVTVYGPAGEPVAQLRGVTLVDLAAGAYRDEVYAGEDLVTISQVTPAGAWTWTPDTGPLRAPPAQAEALRSALDRGLFGLRFGAERDAATVRGHEAWDDLEGTAVDVTTEGVDTTYLFAEDGRMLAQRYTTPQLGEVTVLFSDPRRQNEVLVPFTVTYEVGGSTFLKTEFEDIEPNLDLPDDAFEPPGDASF